MQANELRIGNWVSVDNIYKQIESISKDGINQYEYSLFDDEGSLFLSEAFFEPLGTDKGIYPIPISPEILEACGFVLDKEFFRKGVYCVTKRGDLGGWQFGEWYQGHYTVLKYLHQLQNLIFALTGTELEVNLKP